MAGVAKHRVRVLMMRMAWISFSVAAMPGVAQAPPSEAAAVTLPVLETLVVTGSRIERTAFELPFAVSVIDADALAEAGPRVNLSEAMAQVPGVLVNNRSNYAQDLQISSRGFGARAAFGVRGLRLYADGVPATSPDGQGQVSHFDLSSAERIEVLRGPYSALYGSNSGGVIALFSRTPQDDRLQLGYDVGAEGLRQYRLGGQARLGASLSALGQYSNFRFDGFRSHSAAERELSFARLGFDGDRDRVMLSASHLDQPAQDPLGLTRAQFDADPYQTAAQAETFDTRKTTRQSQSGVNWTHAFEPRGVLRDLQVTGYGGSRAVTQWLAIPAATQANPSHSGGVIDFDRRFYGVDTRLRMALFGIEWIAGVSYDRQNEDRQGYENFIGSGPAQALGVTGALRREERNQQHSFDQYLQGEWHFQPRWTASVGVRHGEAEYDSDDRYLVNGDDSGRRRYTYTNPVAGLSFRPVEALNLYVNGGRGFETPTLAELAYRPDGSSGFNGALRGQTSEQVEVGAKWRGATAHAELALFRAESDDELVVLSNTGGRSSFGNAGRARRQGAELSMNWSPAAQWETLVAATWLDAQYRDGFVTCAGVPCATPTADVAAGNRLPATAEYSAYAELAWAPGAAWRFAVEGRAVSDVAVNDLNTDFAAGYAVFALRGGYTFDLPRARVKLLARVDNLLDREYAGSVIVNEGNSRFFEAGAPRALLLSVGVEPRF